MVAIRVKITFLVYRTISNKSDTTIHSQLNANGCWRTLTASDLMFLLDQIFAVRHDTSDRGFDLGSSYLHRAWNLDSWSRTSPRCENINQLRISLIKTIEAWLPFMSQTVPLPVLITKYESPDIPHRLSTKRAWAQFTWPTIPKLPPMYLYPSIPCWLQYHLLTKSAS